MVAVYALALLACCMIHAPDAVTAEDGHGCEKKLDEYCPGWAHEPLSSCRSCVEANLTHLEPNCTLQKAIGKCGGDAPSPPSPSPSPSPLPPHPSPTNISTPNIFLMLTDDQDIVLGSMNAMGFTRSLGQKGANFTNFFAHTPVCCPSRSELLSGRYFHNIRASGFSASPDCMHVNASMSTPTGDPFTFATVLKSKGYATGAFGKYLNSGGMENICPAPVGNGKLLVPKGWVDFLGACPDTCYVDCTYNHNGVAKEYKNASDPNGSNYGTSVIGNVSVAFIKRAMLANWPFFAYVASHAPHGPATPAPWYANLYSGPDVIAPRTPSFGVHSQDKHWLVRTQPSLTKDYISSEIDDFYKNRMRSLRSVDDIVAEAYQAVEAAGQLDRTYWFFSSDHGLHMGQFCLGPCKRNPYETDVRIPMLMVGPGISAQLQPAMTGIVDLAPTFIDLAGAKDVAVAQTFAMDGRSLVPLVRSSNTVDSWTGNLSWRDAYLIEYYATTGVVTTPPGANHLKDNSNNTFIGLRIKNESHDLAFFQFTDAVTDWGFLSPDFGELYDLTVDPDQLKNIYSTTSSAIITQLHSRLWQQFQCSESTCD